MNPKLTEILKKEADREITEKYSEDFTLENDGLYLIEIIASAKSWRQNLISFRSFFNDDDLLAEIDGRDVFKLSNGSRGAKEKTGWNGNQLKGLSQTVLIALKLVKGKHNLSLLPDQSPCVKFLRIFKAEDENFIPYVPERNNPAQAGDRRQWLSYVLVDLAVKSLTISARVDKKGSDDDDLKLIIDGKAEKNLEDKAHDYWYWCGKILKGEEKEFKKEMNLSKGNHHIELWADNSPFLHKIEIELAPGQGSNPKRIPTVDDPEWTGDFNNDSEEILLARLIFGEANDQPYEAKVWIAWSIINRAKAGSWWPDTVREVVL
jgi:hypothetical protein